METLTAINEGNKIDNLEILNKFDAVTAWAKSEKLVMPTQRARIALVRENTVYRLLEDGMLIGVMIKNIKTGDIKIVDDCGFIPQSESLEYLKENGLTA